MQRQDVTLSLHLAFGNCLMRNLLHFAVLLLLLLIASGQKAAEQTVAQLLAEARIRYDSAQYDRALQTGQKALELSAQGTTEHAECLLLLGDVFLETGDWEAARQQFLAALDIFKAQPGNPKLQMADAENRLGEYFYRKTDYKNAGHF